MPKMQTALPPLSNMSWSKTKRHCGTEPWDFSSESTRAFPYKTCIIETNQCQNAGLAFVAKSRSIGPERLLLTKKSLKNEIA